jgi:hypothetical protein
MDFEQRVLVYSSIMQPLVHSQLTPKLLVFDSQVVNDGAKLVFSAAVNVWRNRATPRSSQYLRATFSVLLEFQGYAFPCWVAEVAERFI